MAALPPYHATIGPVTAAQLGASWHAGCPVGPPQLRRVLLSYVGFDARAHRGELVVSSAVAGDVVKVFRILYSVRFPVRRMRPVSLYGGSDDRSAAADNTSAFNCRFVGGTSRWSMHAYGEAIDVNPVENPYVTADGYVSPPAGAAYTDRSQQRQGMIHRSGPVVAAFARNGWKWSGRTWPKDYQHFSLSGH